MAAFALLALACSLAVMVATGWPTYAVLMAVSCLIAAVGVAVGSFDAALLQALPARVVGLLEHDLLQAVALYAFVGALLRHTPVAGHIFTGLMSGLRRLGVSAAARPALAGFAVGALAAPLNGSVGASVPMLAHAVAPRWRAHGVAAAPAMALTAATATLGVVVPPSLVLLLLGDAMMRAHTEGLALAGNTSLRVINTQDVVQACWPVAALLALAWAVVAAWRAKAATPALGPLAAPATAATPATVPESPAASAPKATPSPTSADATASISDSAPTLVSIESRGRLTAVLAPLVVVALMAGVALGRLRAVEAAATAALLLWACAAFSGHLRGGRLGQVLDDAMALTGSLFALLLAATTLSLVLRAAGCDKLVAAGLAQLASHPQWAAAAVLLGLLLTTFVLDAFEMVFLVVPIVMPPLLAMQNDAAWVACLTLLVLQAGYLLPPWGIATLLARGLVGGQNLTLKTISTELTPYLAVLAGVTVLVFCYPVITQVLRSAPTQRHAAPTNAESTKAAEDLLQQMGGGRESNRSVPETR
jgi:TRAP-type mannitol/chloroaromatic compound transport system permease large subunit